MVVTSELWSSLFKCLGSSQMNRLIWYTYLHAVWPITNSQFWTVDTVRYEILKFTQPLIDFHAQISNPVKNLHGNDHYLSHYALKPTFSVH